MRLDWQTVEIIKIEAQPVGLWHLALEYVPGQRLLRLRVVDKDEKGGAVPTRWKPTDATESGADGIVVEASKGSLLNTAARYGALIAKIGGSSADLPDSAPAAPPYGTKKVFAVGSYCVISLAAADAGPLFMTMNDSADGFKNHSGALHVLVEQYPL